MASGVALRAIWPASRVKPAGGRELPSLPPSAASRSSRQPLRLALVALLDEVVDQFARGVIHLHVERFDTSGEVVEGHNGGDGDEQAERRGDQGFRDAAGNRADARGLLGGDLLEGVAECRRRCRTGRRTEPSRRWWPEPRGPSSAWRGRWLQRAPERGPELAMVSSVAAPPEARNSCRPAVTTSARWDFLLRSAILMASSSLLSFRAPATLGANSRDCLRAADEVQVAVDHHGQRPDGLDEEENGDAAGQPSHVFPEPHGAEVDRLLSSSKKKAMLATVCEAKCAS